MLSRTLPIRARRGQREGRGSGQEAGRGDEGLSDRVGGQAEFIEGDAAQRGQAPRGAGEEEGDSLLPVELGGNLTGGAGHESHEHGPGQVQRMGRQGIARRMAAKAAGDTIGIRS